MSRTKPTETSQMSRLDDAMLDGIFEMSEAELDAEFSELGLAATTEAEKTRAAIGAAMKSFAKASMNAAKDELARYRLNQARGAQRSDPDKAAFDRINTKNSGFAPMMMAARKGKTLSESDEAGLAEDLADLERLDKEPD